MAFTQLTANERDTIYERKHKGCSLAKIAEELGRSKSSVR